MMTIMNIPFRSFISIEQLLPDLVRVFSERPSSKLGVNEKPIWMRTQVWPVKIFGSCGAIKSTDRRKDSHLL